MIIGTAGHIDHGKTTLVKALTGVDTDTLAEEKARGITLDLGFAHRTRADGGTLSFVDVPGHEKLVRHMLAGATGIDLVLLVVAADDGPMPQTREHLAIVDLLGLTRGVLVLTKCDLVGPERRAAARAELRALVAGTTLADAPVMEVSTVTGEGLDALRALLDGAADDAPAERAPAHAAPNGGASDGRAREAGAPLRLAVDRVFTLAGAGTVVTGTAFAGQVAVGDRLVITPRGTEVRVRSLQTHQRSTTEGGAGHRLALGLAGVEKAGVRRGDWLVAPALHAPTTRFDARLRVLGTEPRALAHWTPVHLHLGAEDVPARVLLLEVSAKGSAAGHAVEPGATARVRLELERPIGALRGDRFIVRDQSALRTIGGGTVLDAFAPASRRHRAERLAALDALEQASPEAALAASLALQPSGGVMAGPFFTQWALTSVQAQAVRSAVPHVAIGDGAHERLFATDQVERYLAGVSDALGAHHRKQPDAPGLTQEQLQRGVRDKPAGAVFGQLLQQWLASGRLQRRGAHFALPGHDPSLQGAERALWERLKPSLDEGGLHPPKLTDLLMRDRSLRKDAVLRMFERLARMGRVHAIGAEYFVQTEHLRALAERAYALAQADAHKRLNVKELREATGMSRHFSVPLVEYFDQIGLTRRDEIGRHFRRDPKLVFGG